MASSYSGPNHVWVKVKGLYRTNDYSANVTVGILKSMFVRLVRRMAPILKNQLLVPKETIEAIAFGDRIRAIDGTWFLGGIRNAESEFLNSRIQNAFRFDLEVVRDPDVVHPHMFPPISVMQAWADEARLVRSSDTALVYTQPGSFSASRVWWTLRAYGFSAAILQGGLDGWKRACGATETGAPPALIGPLHTPESVLFDSRYVISIDQLRELIHSDSPPIILDARPEIRFEGKQDEPRPGLARGRIPGAINVPFTELLENDFQSFKSKDEILKVFQDRNIDVQDERLIVTTCGSGVSACVLNFALSILGRSNELTPLYAGSWAEWGARSDTPKEC